MSAAGQVDRDREAAEAGSSEADLAVGQQVGPAVCARVQVPSFTLLEVAKKQISTSPKVQPHVMCSTPMWKAAAAPEGDRERLLSP